MCNLSHKNTIFKNENQMDKNNKLILNMKMGRQPRKRLNGMVLFLLRL